jgi:hypothetical protein
MVEQENEGQSPQESNDKIDNQFKNNMKTLVALLKGDNLLKKTKVLNSSIDGIIEELTKERTDRMAIAFKEKATAAIDKIIAFNSFAKQQEEAMKKAINDKKKELNGELNNLFKDVENIQELQKSYSALLESSEEKKS